MASILVAPGVTIAVFHADAGAPPDAVRYVITSPAVIEDIHCVGYPPVVSATPSVKDVGQHSVCFVNESITNVATGW